MIFNEWLQILSPIIGLTANIFIQVISFRFFPKLGMLKSIILGFIIGFFAVMLSNLFFIFSADMFSKNLVNISAYSALGYCYFHFINLGETARRIRIAREIQDSNNGLTMEEILLRYNARKIVDVRLHRLLKNRQILLKDGRYYVGNQTMLMIAKIIITMKSMLLGKKSEFDKIR